MWIGVVSSGSRHTVAVVYRFADLSSEHAFLVFALDWFGVVISGARVCVSCKFVASIDTSLRESALGARMFRITLIFVLTLQIFMIVISRSRIALREWRVRLRSLPCGILIAGKASIVFFDT